MTQELINVIKVHSWKKKELEEIMDFCVTSIKDKNYIKNKV